MNILTVLILMVSTLGSSVMVRADTVAPGEDLAQARVAARDLNLVRRTDLRLRILVAQAVLLDIRKNAWLLDHVGGAAHPSVRNWSLGVGTMITDALALSYSIKLLTDEKRISFHRDVRRLYRDLSAANERVLNLRATLNGWTRPKPLGAEASALAAELATAEGEVSALTRTASAVNLRPAQRVARVARFTVAIGLGAYLIIDPVLSYAQISLDPSVGDQLGDLLNTFIMDARDALGTDGDDV